MKSIIVLIALFLPHLVWGQHIMGQVVNSKSDAIEYANIALLSKDSAFIAGSVTDSCGNFSFMNPAYHAGFIKVSCVGYIPIIIPILQQDFFHITLQEDSIVLKDIVVKGHLPKYKRVQGGYSIAIQNTILEKLYNANDILESLPRINGNNGHFTIFGKGTPIIYIDNRKMINASELEHLKSTDIDKVTVLTNPGVKYDSETKSVIIIKTRKQKGTGLSGTVDGMYSQKNKAGYNANANLNWRSKHWDVFGALEHANTYGTNKQGVEQTIHGNNHIINEQMTDMLQSHRSKDVLGKIGIDYLPNDSNSLGIQYHYSTDQKSQYMRSHYTDMLYIDDNLEENINYKMSAIPYNGPTNEIDGYWNGKVRNVKFTFDGTYYQSKRDIQNSTNEHSSITDINVTSYKKSDSKFFAAKLIASTDIGKKWSVDAGTEYSYSNFHQSYTNKEGIIESKNNQIRENNASFLFDATYTLDDFAFSAGIRYEHNTNIKYENGIKNKEVSRTYDKIYPNIDLSYNGEDFNIGLSYEMTSDKPSYSDLSSIVAYNSRYFYEGGNPNLNMTLEHNIELSGSYRDLSFSLSYEIDKNPIIRWGQLYDSTGDIIMLTNINIPTLKLLYFSLSAEPSLSFWHPMIEIDVQKQFIDKRGLERNFNKPIAQFQIQNRFVFGNTMIGAKYIFRSCGADGYTFAKTYQKFDAFISKTFLKGNLHVKFQIEDIFKSSKNINEMYSDNYYIKQVVMPTFRNCMLSVSYSFNRTHKRYLGTGAGSSEKNRLL